jgi:Flp pilus assembly protein TadG
MSKPPFSSAPARRARRSRLRARQGGYGVMIALVILVLGSLYGLTRGLAEATVQNRREDQDQAVLRQARDALIAYAALRNSGAPDFWPTRPGALPCPDANDDGDTEGAACGLPATRTGRLPWRTLGLPDLRDSSGERLWFAVSRCFLERPLGTETGICPNGYRVNSDLRGELSVTGLAPQNEVIAIIFAPGAALGGQDRSPAGRNVAANYLEGENGDAANDVFVARTACAGAGAGDCPDGSGVPFNDKLLVIRAQVLFPVVESMVAKHVQTHLRDMMFKEGANFMEKGHFQRWRDHAGVAGQGYFPFAAPFVQPDTSTFLGAMGTLNGLMPVARLVQWELADPTYRPGYAELGGTTDVLGTTTCAASTADQVSCSVYYTNGTSPQVRITAHALGVALSFVNPVLEADLTLANASFVSVANTHATGGAPAGSARVEVVVQLTNRASSDSQPSIVAIPRPPYNLNIVAPEPNGERSKWFIDNNWHHVVLYSVAPAATTALPKDIGTGNVDCAQAGADCRDALNTANGGTNRQLLLLLAGRPVDNNAPRPAAALGRYVEGRNVWTSGAHAPLNQFETFRAGKDRTSMVVGNDRLAVMAP